MLHLFLTLSIFFLIVYGIDGASEFASEHNWKFIDVLFSFRVWCFSWRNNCECQQFLHCQMFHGNNRWTKFLWGRCDNTPGKYPGETFHYINVQISIYFLPLQKCNDTFNCIQYTGIYRKTTTKNFTCKKDRRSAVGDSIVRVADTINPVENFECLTNNLTLVTCSFKQPKSFVPIKFNLRFSLNDEKKVRMIWKAFF